MDKLLSLVDQATSRVGALNTVLDRLVERVVPQTAAAACGGSLCTVSCAWLSNTDCAFDIHPSYSQVYIYATNCYFLTNKCYVWTGNCC